MRDRSCVAIGLLAILGSCAGVGIPVPDSRGSSGFAPEDAVVASSSEKTIERDEAPTLTGPVEIDLQAPRGTSTPARLKTKAIGFRFGPFYPSDGSLADIDNSIGRYGLEFSTRHGGPDGHLSVTGGIEWWHAKGSTRVGATTRGVELDQWTMPFTLFYNTASTAEWSKGKLNLFAGGGVQLCSVYQQSYTVLGVPVYDYEGGWGLQVEGGASIPVGKALYVQGFARYEWVYTWSSNVLVGGIDDLGGFSAGIEVGIRF